MEPLPSGGGGSLKTHFALPKLIVSLVRTIFYNTLVEWECGAFKKKRIFFSFYLVLFYDSWS
jgi:hypothetical protein